MNFSFESKILNSYVVSYYNCPNCNFSCTEEPYWLQEAYVNPIANIDVGIMARNIILSTCATNILSTFVSRNDLCVDYAGGFGILTRLMRDNGFNFKWTDKFTENIFAKSHVFDPSLKPVAITAFEIIEHMQDPRELFKTFLNLNEDAFIILSTETFEVFSKDWWYLVPDTGQHISFFSKKTFQYLAKEFGLNYFNLKGLHLFSKSKISFFRRSAFHLLILPILKQTWFYLFKYLRRSFTTDDFKKSSKSLGNHS